MTTSGGDGPGATPGSKVARFRDALERKRYTLYPGSGPGDWWTYCPGHEVSGPHDPSLHVSFSGEGSDTEEITTWCFSCQQSFFVALWPPHGDAEVCTATYHVKPQDRVGKLYGTNAVMSVWEIHTEDDYLKYCRQVVREDIGGLRVVGHWDYNAGEFRKVKWSNGGYTWLRQSEWADGAWLAGLKSRSNEVELYGCGSIDENTEVVYVVEGEKDVETLIGLGLSAVSYHTVGDRTAKWDCVAGRDVVVLGDNDRTGRDNIARVCDELGASHARSVCELGVFDGSTGYDVSDWILDGGTRVELEGLVSAHGFEPVAASTIEVGGDHTSEWANTASGNGVGSGDGAPLDPKREDAIKKLVIGIEDREEAMRRHRAGEWVLPPDDISYTLDIGLLKEFPHRPSYIDSLLYERNIVTITGAPKIGKTTLTGNIVRCLVDEVPFLNQFTTVAPEGRIGMWNGEMDEQDYVDYLRKMNIRNPGKLVACNLRGRNIPLLDKAPLKWAMDWLERFEIEVWVVDPWAKVLNWCGVDEKDNTGISRIQGAFEEIQRVTGVSTIIIPTHPSKAEGKESSDPTTRGGSVMEGWPDALWKYVKTDGGDDGNGGTEKVCSLYVYGRHITMPATALMFDGGTNTLSLRGGVGDAPRKAGQQESMDKVLALITERPGINQSQIHEAIGGKKENLLTTLRSLEKQDLILVEKKGVSKLYMPSSGTPDWPAGGLGGTG